MTNEEKARILSNKGCLGAYISRDAEALNPTEEDRKRLSIYGACLEAMQWKDDRHKQEKQQFVDKACESFCENCRQDDCRLTECLDLYGFKEKLIKKLQL